MNETMNELQDRMAKLNHDDDEGDNEEEMEEWMKEEASLIMKRTLKTVRSKVFPLDISILPGQFDTTFDHHYKYSSPMKTTSRKKKDF